MALIVTLTKNPLLDCDHDCSSFSQTFYKVFSNSCLHQKAVSPFNLPFCVLQVCQYQRVSCSDNKLHKINFGTFTACRQSYLKALTLELQCIIKDSTSRQSQSTFLCLYRFFCSLCLSAIKGHCHVLTGVLPFESVCDF